MLTKIVPLVIYALWYPMLFKSFVRVDTGLLFFMLFVPVISMMKKILEYPLGNNFADFLLLSMILGTLFKTPKDEDRISHSSPVTVAIVLMVVGSVINLIRGYTFMDFSSDVNLERLMTWKNYMLLPIIYYIALNSIETENKARRAIICLALTLFAMDFNFYSTFRWMRTEHFSHDIRIAGAFTFLGPNEVGVFFTMYTFLLLGLLYYIEGKRLRYFLLIISACNFYPIMYSYSRAAYIGVLVGFLVLGLLKDRRWLVAVVILVLSYSFILPTSVVERIDMTFLDKENTSAEELQFSGIEVGSVTFQATGRRELWAKAEDYFMSHPLLGIGFDTFRHQEGFITHSLYMKILAEQGIVGIVIFIFFTGIVLTQSYRLYKKSGSRLGQGIGLGVLVCTVVHLAGSISGDQSLYYNLMAAYWIFLGIMARFNTENVAQHTKANENLCPQ